MKKTPHIIVVDDDEGVRNLMRDVLSASGYDVETLDSGTKLTKYLENCTPDLIWLDLLMPDTDSLVTLTLIKKRCPEIKVICMSAYATDAVVDTTLALMADIVVSKPFGDIEDIVAITQKVLGES